jgi:hypothetical protein
LLAVQPLRVPERHPVEILRKAIERVFDKWTEQRLLQFRAPPRFIDEGYAPRARSVCSAGAGSGRRGQAPDLRRFLNSKEGSDQQDRAFSFPVRRMRCRSWHKADIGTWAIDVGY